MSLLTTNMFFCSGEEEGGCRHYRTILPSEYLGCEHEAGFPRDLEDPRIIAADVIQLQRATHPLLLEIIPKLKAQGKKFVYDIDDNVWEMPCTNSASRAFNSATLKTMKAIIKQCDAVTVSTVPLKNYFENYLFHDNIHVIPNFIEDVFPQREINSDILTIGFCGTTTHSHDFTNHLVQALRSMKGKCRLVFVGYNPIQNDADEFIKWIPTSEYKQKVYELGIDISIAPLYDNEFNKCKSNLKWLEMGAMTTCFVGSKVYPYENSINNADTGLLISNEKGWKPVFEYLLANRCEIQALANNSREVIDKYYTFKNSGDIIRQKYEKVLSSI